MKFRLFVVLIVILGIWGYRIYQQKKNGGPFSLRNALSSSTASGGGSSLQGKLNAYVDVQNHMIQWEHFDKYANSTEELMATLKKPGYSDSSFPYLGGDVDQLLEKMHKATAMKPDIAEIDPKASALQDALEKLNPLMKQAATYDKTKEYLNDKGARAREFAPQLLAALNRADEMADAFGSAIHDYKFSLDEEKFKALKPGTLDYLTMDVSLQGRRVIDAARSAAHDSSQIAALDTAIDGLVQRNTTLGEFKPDSSGGPKWDAGCKNYKERMDDVIGKARALSVDLKGNKRSSIGSDFDDFFKDYNRAVDDLNDCDK
ncbi:MAG: YiiG family protein [Acidobacteriaceae bacterium]|nr:YiiG family protein [Acidobacteriaceae bacterium]